MTTLEILAPYLPYGIDVQAPTSDGPWLCRMTGLSAYDQKVEYVPLFADGQTGPAYRALCSAVLPVLRCFADLCTPLEDGTVPAVEAMNTIPPLKGRIKTVKYVEHETMGPVVLGYINPNQQYEEAIFLSSFLNSLLTQRQADYLRSKHFAVGLSADQYIRKQS